jgi:hypothetical protein
VLALSTASSGYHEQANQPAPPYRGQRVSDNEQLCQLESGLKIKPDICPAIGELAFYISWLQEGSKVISSFLPADALNGA